MTFPRQPRTLTRCIHRHYSDNGQTTVYFEWSDGSRIECPADQVCSSRHVSALFARVLREHVPFVSETW